MARLFTTAFQFRKQTYTAVVSVTECNETQTVMIYFPDESLHEILPGGRVTFDGNKGLPVDFPQFTLAQELLLAVLSAIKQHDAQVLMHITSKTNQRCN